jgi:acetyl esterase/lipase
MKQAIWLVGSLLLLGGNATLGGPPKIEAPEDARVFRDLEYVPGGHPRQKLDLYLPAKADQPLPLIVWIHGGAWQGGNKEFCPARPLLARGYTVASINYRLSQHAVFPAQIQDCKAAIRWLRGNAAKYGLDPKHIGVWGASAGGHLVALLGTTPGLQEWDTTGEFLDQSSQVQAVVDWFGPTDLIRIDSPGARSPVARLLGGPVKDNKEKAARASPVTHVTKNAAPFLIMHGDKDQVVPYNQSELLTEALKKAGVEVALVPMKNLGHGGLAFHGPASMKQIENFFDRHLKKK